MTNDQPAILVTGGSGFLGSQVLRALQTGNQPRRILAVSRGRQAVAGSMPQPIQHLRLDLADEFALPAGVHTIIHIAGEKRDESRMEAVNHHATRRLVEAAQQSGVRRFVFVSSVGVYGARPHAGLVTETFPHVPQNRYEASKDAGENCVREFCARFGMEFVVVQPSNVIGAVPGRSYPLLGLMRMVRQGRFAWFGNTDSWVNYVAVEDVAAATVAAAERAPSGHTFIINTPERLSLVVGWISDELGVAAPQRRLPMFVGQVAAGLGDLAARLSGRSMPFNRERLLELTNTTRYDGSALKRAVGFNYPLGVEQMIRGLVKTYRCEDRL